MGPKAGKNGGYVFTEGTIEQIKNDKKSMIGPFLTNHYDEKMRPISPIEQLFEFGKIHLSTNQIHTVHPLEVDIPKGKLTVVTGVSGSGKTTLLNCISTIDAIDSGHIYLNNQDMTNLTTQKAAQFRKENLGFIFQDFNLLDTLSIEENIALPLSISNISTKKYRMK